MRLTALPVLLMAALFCAAAELPAAAQDFSALVKEINQKSFGRKIAAVEAVAASGHDRAEPVLRALVNGDLFERESDSLIVIGIRKGGSYALTDAVTGEAAGTAKSRELDKIKTNNRLRGIINAAIGTLALQSREAHKRMAAARAVFDAQDAGALGALDRAIEKESDAAVRKAMIQARASALLSAEAPDAERLEAVAVLLERGGRDSLSILSAAARGQGEVARAALAAVQAIEDRLALWSGVQNAIYGLSLGSVLLLAAIGLAITFGVLGVINMAHGEMVMLGAYTTFVVQEVIRTSMPGLFEWSLLIALPLAFLVAGSVGIAIERGVIRWLYGRPLETLLATWGLSLILQQAVRSIFGPTNREVGNPDWMSGSVGVGELTLTMNRLYIICFALAVFAVLLLVINKTAFGLKMRAVVQNRRMAGNMGIRTSWVDALTFGLGSGIAGIAGVALSQIDNVSPNLGQSYIIDSFLVVVFGGVGNLWGTLVGALTLGIANKFLEPYSGAVLAKILVLVFIILFIQKRPRGLFALKGRAVET